MASRRGASRTTRELQRELSQRRMSAASGASVETAFTSQWVDDCHPRHSLFVVLEREPRNLSKA